LSLAQCAITQRRGFSWPLAAPVLVLGTLATLLKPQFLIIPALCVLHRLFVWKNLRALFAADCLLMAATVVAYIGFLFVFLHDFFTTVLPEIAFVYVYLFRN